MKIDKYDGLTVKKLIKELKQYNPNAKVGIYNNCYPRDYEICFGGAEGCSKKTCDNVNFHINSIKEEIKNDN